MFKGRQEFEEALAKSIEGMREELKKSVHRFNVKHGHYELKNSKHIGSGDEENDGTRADSPQYSHEVHYKGKKIGSIDTRDDDGEHRNIGSDLSDHHDDVVTNHLITKL